jgi:putative ABC transport system permease protein
MSFRGSDTLRMALQMPARNPGRSALTTLGLAIGVGAFIAMVSFGRGARSSVVSQFETLGTNLLRIKAKFGTTTETPHLLTQEDVSALQRESTAFAYVVPHAFSPMDVTFAGRHVRTSVLGALPDIVKTEDWRMGEGGMFDETDVQQRAKVCVLGTTAIANLFAGSDPLGQVITIGGRLPCRVIGVLAQRGSNIGGSDMDDRLMLPLSSYEAFLGLPNGYWLIEVRPKSRALLDAAKLEVVQILRRSHQLDAAADDDFQVLSPDDLTHVAQQISGTLTGLLAAIAAVSLLVGGIGIMNIQLVSVAERTHEIGIRAAIGASPSQIMRQFVAEAVTLATLGSLAGVALGVSASVLVAKQFHWERATSADVVIGSALFGIAVGTLFGYIPARRAARLDPIDALRRE